MTYLRMGVWPKSLATRLIVLLVAALALAQVALIVIIRTQQDVVIDGVVHGQVLNLTVSLARLISASPPSEVPRLLDAFGSRQSCAEVTTNAPVKREMKRSEQNLADVLSHRLHGVNAGAPEVAIQLLAPSEHPCTGVNDAAHDSQWAEDDRQNIQDENNGQFRIVALKVDVPFPDGRWLIVHTAIDVPGVWNWVGFMSFLLSSLAAAFVAIVAVRSQTKSLRALANASERLGRGETLAPLEVTGPSEVAATTQAFNTMQKRLSLFIRDRLRLLASISHDLRTPLTTLRLKAEFIEDDAIRDDVVKTIDELSIICEATLAFTRAEASKEETALTDLSDLIGRVGEEFRLAQSPIEVTPSSALWYSCRPVALKRALRNLIENALRYGGTAAVALRTSEDAVSIIVEDDGPGMPADQIEDAFQPFVRLEPSRNMETGGLGLGLSIARSIVQAHGGSLILTNRSDGGLRAEIRLPPHPREQSENRL
ncbi:MAG: HAMP domain-containing protein [Rhizobiaceae bacterium]|nr:HAMP domain-containing protein [Rhizobiaceae bacterium]